MTNEATPGKLRLTEGLGPLVDAEMAAYYEGEYIDHDDAKERLWAFAAAVQAAERERCAKIADEHARRNYPWGSENTDRYHAQADWAERIAAVIRRA